MRPSDENNTSNTSDEQQRQERRGRVVCGNIYSYNEESKSRGKTPCTLVADFDENTFCVTETGRPISPDGISWALAKGLIDFKDKEGEQALFDALGSFSRMIPVTEEKQQAYICATPTPSKPFDADKSDSASRTSTGKFKSPFLQDDDGEEHSALRIEDMPIHQHVIIILIIACMIIGCIGSMLMFDSRHSESDEASSSVIEDMTLNLGAPDIQGYLVPSANGEYVESIGAHLISFQVLTDGGELYQVTTCSSSYGVHANLSSYDIQFKAESGILTNGSSFVESSSDETPHANVWFRKRDYGSQRVFAQLFIPPTTMDHLNASIDEQSSHSGESKYIEVEKLGKADDETLAWLEEMTLESSADASDEKA